ncbi:Phenylpyruvate tautomerase PptA, 4-oxalocrotonate tautomerase family [Halalkaliarchaeum sp. AArc-CO]|uniref:tautomerase family protein n=1 Tax=unclassified Halalkaliarchaeum TaxID=2678344 RepID=UPI00217DCA4A|nr:MULTISPECIES: tautomerase family protein [unclassified Halalkaliarchaeum]MDR5674545.1 tautomerase family protein [Halalkaliarchaeum sp. AArc-GB]UWG49460.1 Phenylpyruvate tautomerase PptA, 4-oxalocrotonate tautomerase family [Halalkaliarchaeum sp. AArc-CO]
MPHLQFDVDFSIDDPAAEQFTADVAELYADTMDASTEYTAVSLRRIDTIYLGRATGERRVILQADVRAGREVETKREFALAVIETVAERFDVPRSNQKVVFTEHDGSQMMGHDRVGDDWSE